METLTTAGMSSSLPVPAAAQEAADAAAFMEAGGRIAMLVAPQARDRSALLDGVLERMQGPAIHVGNTLNSPLSLHRVLFQAGAVGTEADKAAALMRSLSRQAVQGRIVLAVTDAQTLTPDALTVLIRTAVTARFEMRLVLLGQPSLLHAAAAPGFEALRDPAITRVGPGTAIIAAAKPDSQPVAPASPAPVSGAWRRVVTGLALGAAFLAAGAVWVWQYRLAPPAQTATDPAVEQPPVGSTSATPDPMPTPASGPKEEPIVSAPTPAEPSPSSEPTAEAPPPQPTPEPPGAQTPDEGQLRRDFDAFLDRSGNDTATLSPAARGLLFQEYLIWRSRHAGED